jgi:hypothetical protein
MTVVHIPAKLGKCSLGREGGLFHCWGKHWEDTVARLLLESFHCLDNESPESQDPSRPYRFHRQIGGQQIGNATARSRKMEPDIEHILVFSMETQQ